MVISLDHTDWTALIVALVPLCFFLHSSGLAKMFKSVKLDGKHVFITGGSKGLGLALAVEFVRRGCHVSIAARDAADLATALQCLEKEATSSLKARKSNFHAFSVDVCDSTELKKALQTAETASGPIDILVLNAGVCIPGLLLDQDIDTFQRLLDLNLLANVKATQLVLPGMMSRQSGHLVYVASPLSVLGFAGYSAYCASKWALRGFVDSLRNETQGTGVTLSIGYPPDTDTPGFAKENETKPGLCVAVNKALGNDLYSPEKVAKCMVKGISRGDYHLPTPDLGSSLLLNSMAGLTPKPIHPLLTAFLAPLTVFVSSFFRWRIDSVAKKFNSQENL